MRKNFNRANVIKVIENVDGLASELKAKIKKAINTLDFNQILNEACLKFDQHWSQYGSDYTIQWNSLKLGKGKRGEFWLKKEIWTGFIKDAIEKNEITFKIKALISEHKKTLAFSDQCYQENITNENEFTDFYTNFKEARSVVEPIILILYLMSYLFKFKYEDIEKNSTSEIEKYSTHLTEQYQLKREHFLNLLLCLNLAQAVPTIEKSINNNTEEINVNGVVIANAFMFLLKDTRQMKGGIYTKLVATLLEILKRYSNDQLNTAFSPSGILGFKPLSLNTIDISEVSKSLYDVTDKKFSKTFLKDRINSLFGNFNSGLKKLKTINIPFSERLTDQENGNIFCYELYALVNDFKTYDTLETEYAKEKQFEALHKKANELRKSLFMETFNDSNRKKSKVNLIELSFFFGGDSKDWSGENKRERFLRLLKPFVCKFIELITYEKDLSGFKTQSSETWVEKQKGLLQEEFTESKKESRTTFYDALYLLSFKGYTYKTQELLIDQLLTTIAENTQLFGNEESPLYFTKSDLKNSLGYNNTNKLAIRYGSDKLSFFKNQLETNPKLMANTIYNNLPIKNLPIKSVINFLFSKKKKGKGKEKTNSISNFYDYN